MILSDASAAPRVSDPRSRRMFAFVLVVKPTPVPTLPPTPSPPPTIPPAWAGERPHRHRQNVSNSEPEKHFNSSSGFLIVPQSAEEPRPTSCLSSTAPGASVRTASPRSPTLCPGSSVLSTSWDPPECRFAFVLRHLGPAVLLFAQLEHHV